MNKQEHDEAIALLKEICREIGCSKVSKTCDEAPQLCSIIRKLVMPSNTKLSHRLPWKSNNRKRKKGNPMTDELKGKSFLLYCPSCKRKHRVINRPCPACGVYPTPQPKSDKVYDKCMYLGYCCDGCEAYKDHLR